MLKAVGDDDMKKYIKASTEYLSGSYLLDRDGNLQKTMLHVPSTTFINRGLMFLSPTDAGLLYRLNKISEYDVDVILTYNLEYFLEHEKHSDAAIFYSMEFSDWAELKYVPQIRTMFTAFAYGNVKPKDTDKQFNKLNDKWYTWLQNNFVKVSVLGNTAEFRITSEDGYNWNDIIIDDVILSYDWKPGTKFNVLKEDEEGYKAYFLNATMDDILENDDIILSNTLLNRQITSGELRYKEVK